MRTLQSATGSDHSTIVHMRAHWPCMFNVHCSLMIMHIYLRVLFEFWVNDVWFISLQLCVLFLSRQQAMRNGPVCLSLYVQSVRAQYTLTGIRTTGTEMHESCAPGGLLYEHNSLLRTLHMKWYSFKRIWWMSPNYAYHFVCRTQQGNVFPLLPPVELFRSRRDTTIQPCDT